MERVSLYEELRLIERNESEVNGIWKGAHLLLFFLAFVFGSFCTFCFHMLMYLFDEKCVLYPKLLSLTSLRHNFIYEFIPEEKEMAETLPVDFLSTQWVEKSACYLPTYVPLVSGIFGLVWTTMFLMCSSGGRSNSGLQRSWRVIPPVLIFSIAMSGLCIYSSTITQNGLQELCVKLGEITGSATCSYTVNVATLAYERQIRGVYQATQLTISSAWMHTGCWLASAALAFARILLAVDFRLVKIRVELVGDIDKMLERNEQHLQTVMPNVWTDDEELTSQTSVASTQVVFRNDQYDKVNEAGNLAVSGSDILYISRQPAHVSALSLHPEERNRLAKMQAYKTVGKGRKFLVNIVYDLIDEVIHTLSEYDSSSNPSTASTGRPSKTQLIVRQYGQQTLSSKGERYSDPTYEAIDSNEATDVRNEIKQQIQKRSKSLKDNLDASPTTSKYKGSILLEPPTLSLYGSEEIKNEKSEYHRNQKRKKSSLKTTNSKNIGVQTERYAKNEKFKVTISESKSTYYEKHDVGSKTYSENTISDQTYVKDEDCENRYPDSKDPHNESLEKKISEKNIHEKENLDIKESAEKYAENAEKKSPEKKDPEIENPKDKGTDKKDKDFQIKEKQD